ncbi:MAG: thioesterase domain-containing protein [Xanthobacteraceae bacterium]
MKRSGLLTAVFALAIGILVALGASPGAAQPQPRAHVYLLRGLFNVFSLGMDSLTEELKRRGVYATVHGYGEWQTLADRAAADYKAGKEAPIILIGHSLGADAVMEMAAYLGRKGVPVAMVVPFDGTKSFAASDNVGRVLNLTQRDYAYMRGGPGFHGTLANVDVSSDSSIDHINIDKSPRLHTRVVAEVLAVVGNHKAAPAKNGNGADARTLGEQEGSRQNADNPAPPAHKPPAGTQPLHTEEMIPN